MKRIPLLLALLALAVPWLSTAQGLDPTIMTTNTALVEGYREARVLSLEPHIELFGTDPDGSLHRPTYYRFLYKPAKLGQVYVNTEYYFEQYMDRLVSWDDPRWSDWYAWDEVSPVLPRTVFKERDINGDIAYYLLALQCMDADGAVSVDRTYGRTVHNFRVSSSLRPVLTVREPNLGTFVHSGISGSWSLDVAPTQPVRFTWLGTADPSAGELVGYRWGWDIVDVNDPNDPGWAVPDYGLGFGYDDSGETVFNSGMHTLTVECLAQGMPITRIVFHLDVVPVPEPEDQLPLLLVDDVTDSVSNGWPNPGGDIAYDRDPQRDARWLQLIGGAQGFDPERDVVDLEGGQLFGFRDVAPYRNLIWSSRAHPETYVAREMTDRYDYNWLSTYQRMVGNVLMVGAGAVTNFSQRYGDPDEEGLEWLFPVIYESIESPVSDWWGELARSHGIVYVDGLAVPAGTLTYGYSTLGLGLVDLFATETSARTDEVPCERLGHYTGTKRLVLDPAFAAAHDPAGDLPALVLTDALIDWADAQGGLPAAHSVYPFTAHEEFYDVNVSGRTTAWSPQERPDGGPMVEPMWRNVARWDWLLEAHRDAGNLDFPTQDDIDIAELSCDPVTFEGVLTPGGDVRTRVGGVPVGFFSYATVDTKPSGRPDVVWGFDPTRFDPVEMGRVVRWVLGEHFGLSLSTATGKEVSR